MESKQKSKPAIGDRVLWYQREDLAWYTMVIKSDLIASKNGVGRVQAAYEDYPEERPFLIPHNELFRMPEKF